MWQKKTNGFASLSHSSKRTYGKRRQNRDTKNKTLRYELLEVRALLNADPGFTSDDRDAPTAHTSFITTGSWADNGNAVETFQGDRLFANGGTGTKTATWSFTDITPGIYQISTTWQPHTNRNSAAPYEVSDGTSLIATVAVDQRFSPQSDILVGAEQKGFEHLGAPLSITNDNLQVTLSNNGSGYVVADAVHIQRIGNLEFTSDDRDAPTDHTSFATAGTWTDNGNSAYTFQGDRLNSLGGSGQNTATWTFSDIPAGYYQLSTTWQHHPNRSSVAPYNIYDGTTFVRTELVNQKVVVGSDVLVGAEQKNFEHLGLPVEITGNSLVVTLSNDGSGGVVADAIHIQQLLAPEIENNSLTIDEEETVVLTSSHLSATDEDSSAAEQANLTFTMTNVLHGFFANLSAPATPIISFTQQQITSGEITFVHDGGEIAPSYDVSVSDGVLDSTTVAGNVTFNSVNDAPVLSAPSYIAIDEDTPYDFVGANTVSISDVDAGGADVRVNINLDFGGVEIQPEAGVEIVLEGDNPGLVGFLEGSVQGINQALASMRYLPLQDYHGFANLALTVNDLGNSGGGGAQLDSQNILFDIFAVNDAPEADAGGPYVISEGQGVTLDGSASFDVESALIYNWHINGQLASNLFPSKPGVSGPTPTFSWAELSSFGIDDNGNFNIELFAEDEGAEVDLATTSLSVNNVVPDAVDDTETTTEDGPTIIIDVLDNDTDPVDSLTVASFDDSTLAGSLTYNNDGTFVYHPNGQFEGLAAGESATDSFLYTITDGDDTSNAVVNITVTGINDAPVANTGGDYVIDEGQSLALDGSGSFDAEGPLTYHWHINGQLASNLFPSKPGVSGPSPAFTWSELDLFNIDDKGSYTIELYVEDEDFEVDLATATLTVQDIFEAFGETEITVTTTSDLLDLTPLGDGIVDVDLSTPGYQISLRAAVQEANSLGLSIPVTIHVPSGHYDLTLSGTEPTDATDVAINDLDVRSQIVIQGAGAGTTEIDAQDIVTGMGSSAAFAILPDGQATLKIQGVSLLNELLYIQENPPTSLPSGSDRFSPNLIGSAGGPDAPVIGDFSSTAGPGESLTISGYRLSTTTTLNNSDMGADTKVLVYGVTNDGELAYQYANVLRVDGGEVDEHEENSYQVAMIVLPETLPTWSTYVFWVGNDEGWSDPQVANRTEAWWAIGDTVYAGDQTSTVSAGDQVSLHGRNLAHNNQTGTAETTVYVEARDASGTKLGTGVLLTAANNGIVEVNPYRIELNLPENDDSDGPGSNHFGLSAQEISSVEHFSLFTHNGHGGQLGWSEVIELEADNSAKTLFDESRTIVNLFTGAQLPGNLQPLKQPDGSGNHAQHNADQLVQIFNHFRNIGTDFRLYLPEGDYYLNHEVSVKSNISLYGDGPTKTRLIAVDEDEFGNFDDFAIDRYLFQVNNSSGTVRNVGFKDLSILAGVPSTMGTPENLNIVIPNPTSFGTKIKVHPDGSPDLSSNGGIQKVNNSPALLWIGADNVLLDNVAIHSGTATKREVVVTSTEPEYEGEVRSYTGRAMTMRFQGTENVALVQSTIIGENSILSGSKSVRVDDVKFRLRSDANAAISFKNGSEISIVDSFAQDDDNSDASNTDGWGTGRFVVVASDGSTPRNLYFGENETFDLSRNATPGLGIAANEGEQFLFEETQNSLSAAAGDVIANSNSNPDAVKFVSRIPDTPNGPNPPDTGANETLIVVDGRGFGQYRIGSVTRIGTTDTYEFIPHEPWNIVPDESSVVVVSHVPQQSVIYANRLDFKDDAQTATIRSFQYEKPLSAAGIVIADGGLDLVLAGNTIQQASGGISVGGGDFGTPNENANKDQFAVPLYWTRIADNKIGESFGNNPNLDPRVSSGISVTSRATDAGNVTLGVHVSDNVVKTRDVQRRVIVKGVNDDDPNRPVGDLDDLYSNVASGGLGLGSFYSNAANSNSGNDVAKHTGPAYVSFDNNEVYATKSFRTSRFSINTGPTGGTHYLVDGHAEHVALYGNYFAATEGSTDPTRLEFNLVVDQTVKPLVHPDSTIVPRWGRSSYPDDAKENYITPPLPEDYRFHVLEENSFGSTGTEYSYGFINGVDQTTLDLLAENFDAATAERPKYVFQDSEVDGIFSLPEALRVLSVGNSSVRIRSIQSDQSWLTVLDQDNLIGINVPYSNLVQNFDVQVDSDALSSGDNSAIITIVLEDELGNVFGDPLYVDVVIEKQP